MILISLGGLSKTPNKAFNMTLDEYLLIRFNRSNHPKYRKYAVEWINNLTTEQLSYFEKEMLKSLIRG